MSILLIAGSPSQPSRSSALLNAVAARLQAQGLSTEPVLQLNRLDPAALLHARFDHPEIRAVTDRVARADAVVVATPVYKAAYSGLLKVFLDVLPQTALKGKLVLPLATGGSPHHMLALDYALRPVLQSLGARHILPGIYATDQGCPCCLKAVMAWPPRSPSASRMQPGCWPPICAAVPNGPQPMTLKASRSPTCDVAFELALP